MLQADAEDIEKPSSHGTEDDVGEMTGSCQAEDRATTSVESTASSEITARQTKPKKLNKKQLLAEQRRKDRVCVEFSAVIHLSDKRRSVCTPCSR